MFCTAVMILIISVAADEHGMNQESDAILDEEATCSPSVSSKGPTAGWLVGG